MRIGTIDNTTAKEKALGEVVVDLLNHLDDGQLDRLSAPLVEQARKRVRRYRNRLSAYKVELAEAKRAIPDLEAQLEKALDRERQAKKKGVVEHIAEVQRDVSQLKNRVRSYQENIPLVEATIEQLEAAGPA